MPRDVLGTAAGNRIVSGHLYGASAVRQCSISSASETELKALCRAAPRVRAHLDGREAVKEVVVPGRLVNLVVR